jgi:hypothetical protein
MTFEDIRRDVFMRLDWLAWRCPGKPWDASLEQLALMFARYHRDRRYVAQCDGFVIVDDAPLQHDFFPYVSEWFDTYPNADVWIVHREMGLL